MFPMSPGQRVIFWEFSGSSTQIKGRQNTMLTNRIKKKNFVIGNWIPKYKNMNKIQYKCAKKRNKCDAIIKSIITKNTIGKKTNGWKKNKIQSCEKKNIYNQDMWDIYISNMWENIQVYFTIACEYLFIK